MKQFISLVFFSCLALFSLSVPPAVRAEANLEDVIATVEQSYNSLTDLQAAFSQKTYLASVKRERKGVGTLSIKKVADRPAMFRFDYTKPKQLIVSNGVSVWFYLSENRQVMITNLKGLFEGSQGITLNYLTGMGRISRDFTISFLNGGRDDQGNYLLELIPKKPNHVLTKLQMTVSEKAVETYLSKGKIRNTFPLLSSVFFDQFGTKTTIEFSNVRVNRKLPASLFRFTVPAGVEVVRQ
ncbi:MAG TPA: outer membrane lipoprotein carrier protein LolA [Geobacteraceae bacterium]|nr:outer membrane lipoprotein carrier protein LolA [Geobacteraceae bacterium]